MRRRSPAASRLQPAAASALRPLRLLAGRFVRPVVDERLALLQSAVGRLALRHEAEARALEERLARRIEAVRAEAMADARSRERELADRLAAGRRPALEELEREVSELRRRPVVNEGALEERLGVRVESLRSNVNANVLRIVEGLNARWAADLDEARRALTLDVDRTRTRMAIADADVAELERYRRSADYARIFELPEPLVTVIVTTYDRAELLVDRCLRSILAQDYRNLEIIVMGDGCTDDTEARVRTIGDPRITFTNFVEPTLPPGLSFGAEAANAGLAMATGDFITHLDDDDEYTPDRIGSLVAFLQRERAELVWHPFWWQESSAAAWSVNEAERFDFANVTTGSVLYISWFKRLPWDPLAFRLAAPDDWTRFRSLRDVGARTARYPEPLLRHYREGQNPRWREGLPAGELPKGRAVPRRSGALLPIVESDGAYEELRGKLEPWIPAFEEVGRRTGVSANGELRQGKGGDFPVAMTPDHHVVKLFGPWSLGPGTFRDELAAYRLVHDADGLPVPRLVAHGSLTPEWRYLVTTEVPGVPLSAVRSRIADADLRDVFGWLGDVVRRLHAVPLPERERAEGWDAFVRMLAWRHDNATRIFTERGSVPGHLAAELDGWLPPLADLLPGPERAVLLHADLHDDHVLGREADERFEPTGVIDLGRAHVGHPYYELGAMNRWLFQGDGPLLGAFLATVGWPGARDPDFPTRALAFVVLNAADQLAGLPALEQARDLDDLADRLFAPPAG